MKNKFLNRTAIAEILAWERAANAQRRRRGLRDRPLRFIPCGCPSPGCGGFFVIAEADSIPSAQECQALLAADSRSRKGRGQATNRRG
jgi:hypothetical protein